jgi:hypothetical protein
MSLLSAIDNAHVNGSEFEMPDIGPFMMFTLREMVRGAVRYAAEVNDLQLTLHTHADIGGLERFIETYKLEKVAAAARSVDMEIERGRLRAAFFVCGCLTMAHGLSLSPQNQDPARYPPQSLAFGRLDKRRYAWRSRHCRSRQAAHDGRTACGERRGLFAAQYN